MKLESLIKRICFPLRRDLGWNIARRLREVVLTVKTRRTNVSAWTAGGIISTSWSLLSITHDYLTCEVSLGKAAFHFEDITFFQKMVPDGLEPWKLDSWDRRSRYEITNDDGASVEKTKPLGIFYVAFAFVGDRDAPSARWGTWERERRRDVT